MSSLAPTAALSRSPVSVLGFVRASLDAAIVIACLLLSSAIVGTAFGGPELVLALVAFSLTFPSEVSVRRINDRLMASIAGQWLFIALVLVLVGYVTRFLWYFDPRFLAWWLATTPFAMYAAHRAIPRLLPQLLAIDGMRSAVVVAANEVGRKLASALIAEPALGFSFVGYFDDPSKHALPEGPILGAMDEAVPYVNRHRIETVFIALPMVSQPSLLKLLDDIKDTTASVYFVPDIFITELISARIADINGMPVVAVCESPIVGINALVKRGFDLLVGSLAVLVFAPAMLAIAGAVKLGSPGPVLFRQRRYGLDGREIVVWKFRSMTVVEDGATVMQAAVNDARVTRIGRFLRSTSLDELPQLFNVLGGSMSLVGPRPHAVTHNEQYRRLVKGYMIRHKVKPGITGWAQVNGFRGATETVEKMQARIEHDLDYVRHWSLKLDLMILIRTAGIVLRRTNAH